jgi:hypothetical protein
MLSIVAPFKTILKRLGRDKHYSSLVHSVIDEEKSFIMSNTKKNMLVFTLLTLRLVFRGLAETNISLFVYNVGDEEKRCFIPFKTFFIFATIHKYASAKAIT